MRRARAGTAFHLHSEPPLDLKPEAPQSTWEGKKNRQAMADVGVSRRGKSSESSGGREAVAEQFGEALGGGAL